MTVVWGQTFFPVSVIDATVQVKIGTVGTDEAIANEIREQFKETIYILRYINNSWSYINETLKDEQQELREALSHAQKEAVIYKKQPIYGVGR